MPISVPVGPIVKAVLWAQSWVTKKLFLKTYRFSHAVWTGQHRLGAHWQRCGAYLEYSLFLANAADREPRVSQIAFRAVDEPVKFLSLVLEAESSKARYQERISGINIDSKPITWRISNVPHQEFLGFSAQGDPQFSLDTLKIHVCELKLLNGRDVAPFSALTSCLTHSWFLNSTWKYRWNQSWNLDAVFEAKRCLRMYWKFRFGQPAVRCYGPATTEGKSVWQLLAIGLSPIAWLMSRDCLISLQFWGAIWSGLYVITDKESLHWRWAKSNRWT